MKSSLSLKKESQGNLERSAVFHLIFWNVQKSDHWDGTPFYYRNKAQFPFGTDKEGNPVTGFYAGRTHDIIANT